MATALFDVKSVLLIDVFIKATTSKLQGDLQEKSMQIHINMNFDISCILPITYALHLTC